MATKTTLVADWYGTNGVFSGTFQVTGTATFAAANFSGAVNITTTGTQLTLTYSSNTYTTLTTNSSGNLVIAPIGTKTTTAKQLEVSVATSQLVLSTATFNVASNVVNVNQPVSVTSTSVQFNAIYDGSNNVALSCSSAGAFVIAPSGTKTTTAKQVEISVATNQLVLSTATFNVASNVVNVNQPLAVTSTSTQLDLKYDGSNNATFAISAVGVLTVAPSGTKTTTAKQIEISVATNQLVLSTATFNVASNVVNVNQPAAITSTSTQLDLKYDGSNNATFAVSAAGVLTVAPSGTKTTTAKQVEISVATNQLVLSTATFNVASNVVNVSQPISVTSTASQLLLRYDASNTATFAVNSTGDLFVTPTGFNTTLYYNLSVDGNSSSANRDVVYVAGTNAYSTTTICAMTIDTTLAPTSNMTAARTLWIYPQMTPGTARTITSAYALHVDAGTIGAGTVTTGYGLYVAEPAFGTTKYTAFLAGNVVVGTNTLTSGLLQVRKDQNAETYVCIANENNTGSAGTHLDLRVGGTSAADPYITFVVAGQNNWSIGLDNSDSDKLKIDYGSSVVPGSSTKASITSLGEFQITCSAESCFQIYQSTAATAGFIRYQNQGGNVVYCGVGASAQDFRVYTDTTRLVVTTVGVDVTGTLTKTAGVFKINHPLAPDTKWLQHSFVESPDMMNVYNGIVTLDSHGNATVTMPDWFMPLNRDFRYQLTAMNQSQPNLFIASPMTNGSFIIEGGRNGGVVSWQVTGIRQDQYANDHRVQVEVDK